MKDNVIDQLREALGILSEYPGIENTLDVKKAQEFLSDLSKFGRALSAPSFDEVNAEEVGRRIQETSLEEWLDALQELPGVFATDEMRDRNYDDGSLIWGAVDKHLNASKEDYNATSEDEYCFEFEKNNEASVGILKDGNWQHGTWAEIYQLIVEHVNENLRVPDIPK